MYYDKLVMCNSVDARIGAASESNYCVHSNDVSVVVKRWASVPFNVYQNNLLSLAGTLGCDPVKGSGFVKCGTQG